MTFGNRIVSNSKEFVEVFLAVQNMKSGMVVIPYNYVGIVNNLFHQTNDENRSYYINFKSLDKDEKGRIDFEKLAELISESLKYGNAKVLDDHENECVVAKLPDWYICEIYSKYTIETAMRMGLFIDDFENECLSIYENDIKLYKKTSRYVDKIRKNV